MKPHPNDPEPMQVRLTQATYRADIRALLVECALPVDDLDTASVDFIAATQDARLVGVVGLEAFGDAGLLRSLAIGRSHRGIGLGASLVDALEARARACGMSRLVLLTTTADRFFARHGYRVIERSAAPSSMQRSREFSALCPATATCMSKHFG